MKKVGKVILIFVISIILLITIIVIALNVAKHFIYSEYYDCKTYICENPGLGDGFVCQGIFAYEKEDKIIISGYMTNSGASRIYVTDSDNNDYYVSTYKNGEKFTGHLGGICYADNTVYAASEKRVYSFSIDALLKAENGDIVEIGEGVEVNNNASFIYSDDTFIYVGEFNDGGKYKTFHTYETNEGEHNAIISVYSKDNLKNPVRIYSIRDRVQGVCFTPNGKVVLSTSFGLSSSYYYVYNKAEAVDSGFTLDGVPVYYLDNCVKKIKGPAMAEGLDYYDGRVITLTESASNKYIFGKLFFANDIIGLSI